MAIRGSILNAVTRESRSFFFSLALFSGNAIHAETSDEIPTEVPHGTGQVSINIFGSSNQCADCHPRQFEQWRDSRHARALSPGVLGQLEAFDDATVRMCLRCHAPVAAETEEIDIGKLASDEAVGCMACHVREGRITGPRDFAETPHGPVSGDGRFRQAEFCAPCHQFEPGDVAVNGKLLENTLEEWRSSRYGELGVTCQACHMAAGYHGFRGIHDPATVRRALSMSVKRTPKGVQIDITNVGAGHALPTYITPRIDLLLLEPKQERPLRRWGLQRRMDWTPENGWRELSDTRLGPGETRRLVEALPGQAPITVSIVVAPDADYHDRVYPSLIRELGDQIDTRSLALLHQAWRESRDSGYELFRFFCRPARAEAFDCE